MKKLFSLFLCALLLTGCARTYDGPTASRSVVSGTQTLYHDEDGEIFQCYRTEYAYDIYGNQSQILEYTCGADAAEDEPHLKTVLRYNEAGNLVRMTQYDLSGWFPRKLCDNRYTYDALGRMTGSTHSEEDTVIITHDDENRTRTTASGGSATVEYLDENGFPYRSEHTTAGGQAILKEYDRRADGEWERIRTYRSGTLESVTERTFDAQGRPILWTEKSNGETTVVFRYEYGDGYDILYYADGRYTTTDYNDDGTVKCRLELDKDGTITCETIYRYTEIQVPAEEEATP